jgi:hypothetical protein
LIWRKYEGNLQNREIFLRCYYWKIRETFSLDLTFKTKCTGNETFTRTSFFHSYAQGTRKDLHIVSFPIPIPFLFLCFSYPMNRRGPKFIVGKITYWLLHYLFRKQSYIIQVVTNIHESFIHCSISTNIAIEKLQKRPSQWHESSHI